MMDLDDDISTVRQNPIRKELVEDEREQARLVVLERRLVFVGRIAIQLVIILAMLAIAIFITRK